MRGVTKEGLTGWENDKERCVHEPLHAAVIGAYRILKSLDYSAAAGAVRDMANQAVILGYQVAEARRQAAEGKVAQPWEEFVRPFAAMDREQLEAWIGEFRAGVAEAKARGKNG